MGALDITLKDLKLLFRDTRALTLLVMLPLLFIAIIGMATGQLLTKDADRDKFKILLCNLSQSQYSQEFAETLHQHPDMTVLPCSSQQEGHTRLLRDEAGALVVIGSEFEARVDELKMVDIIDSKRGRLANGLTDLDVKIESRPLLGGNSVLIEWLIFADALRTVSPIVAEKNRLTRGWVHRNRNTDAGEESPAPQEAPPEGSHPGEAVAPEGEKPSLDKQANAEPAAQNTGDTTATATPAKPAAKKRDQYTFLVPGFTVMFVFFLINIMARSFIAERDHGTLRRLRLAPISPLAMIIGKTVPFYLTSLVQAVMLFISGRLLFQMSWGNEPLYLLPVIACTSLAATGLGLFVASIVKTDQQVSAFGTAIVLCLSGVSGCFMPRAFLPEMMKQISLATPHAWALLAFDEVLSGRVVNPDTIAFNCMVLLLFSLGFFTFGWWRFRGEQYA